ncbi:MAG: hypothetical protein IJH32_05010 [Ruminococcus sp.]|nr:hypothetical protein [Ruminococcus sp.]
MATIFTNQATLNYNGEQIRSNITTGSIEGVLSLTKEAIEDSYRAEDTLTYVVSIVNNSDEAVTGITFTDDLGAYTFETGTVQPLSYVDASLQYYANGVMQNDPAADTTNGLVITGLTVPADGNVTLIYSAQVNEFAPLGTDGEIINTVTLDGQGITPVSASETVAVTSEALLSILKAVTPIPVAENGELTYTFQLQNSGNTPVTEADNATVTDTFSPALSNISVVFNGETMAEGTDYTYDESTGVFATADGALSIPAATYTQDTSTGAWSVTPGVSTLVITGNIHSID